MTDSLSPIHAWAETTDHVITKLKLGNVILPAASDDPQFSDIVEKMAPILAHHAPDEFILFFTKPAYRGWLRTSLAEYGPEASVPSAMFIVTFLIYHGHASRVHRKWPFSATELAPVFTTCGIACPDPVIE